MASDRTVSVPVDSFDLATAEAVLVESALRRAGSISDGKHDIPAPAQEVKRGTE